ncbi:MAG: PAS domain S-box protein [Phycisphaerae bacterium]|nr:ATP-binding protein [Phycisphaerae bacterium]NUQ47944.1 PAS domain S-box protein [Phycisphaerae bacterium]
MNASADRREDFIAPQALATLLPSARPAILLGFASVLAALIMAVLAYRLARNESVAAHQQFYLRTARLIAAAGDKAADRPDAEVLRMLHELWNSQADRAPDSYVCVVDGRSLMRLHSLAPQLVDSDPGDNPVLGNESQPECRLRELIAAQREYVGGYRSSLGQSQIAAFAPIRSRGWLVGVHRSSDALLREVRADLDPLMIAFVLVCGVLMPLSLWLLQRRHSRLLQRSLAGEHRARDNEERYRTVVAALAEGVVILDRAGRIIDCNRSAERILGLPRERLLRMSTDEPGWQTVHEDGTPFPSDTYPAIRALRTGEPQYDVVMGLRKPDGEQAWISINAQPLFGDDPTAPLGVVASFADITRRWRAEGELARHRDRLEQLVRERTAQLEASQQQLRQSERLASIGTLAAGIAHEINNPLGLILLRLDDIRHSLNDASAVESCLEAVAEDVNRCARIVKGVLRFARRESSEKWASDLNRIVRSAVELTGDYVREHGVRLELTLTDDLPPILGNDTELEQVVVNLLQNAVHACAGEGRITVQTRRDTADVVLMVCDDGCGMSPEHRARAFDPFFTTRFDQGGTGLGLSTCHGIVTDHGGSIDIDSQHRRGTMVTVRLPIAQESRCEGKLNGESAGRG